MKKTILLAVAALALAACGNKANTPKDNGLEKAADEKKQGVIAYVELDSINSQYQYAIDMTDELETRQKNYASQLSAKAQALQNAMNSAQQKAQKGEYTSQEQVQQAQASLQRQQQQYENLEAKYQREMLEATNDFNKSLRDSIQNFIAEFNKDGRYAMILGKQDVSLLYADPALNITDQVIKGLNKRYTKK